MKKILILIAFCFAIVSTGLAKPNQSYNLKLKSGTVAIKQQSPNLTIGELAESNSYIIIQFHQTPDSDSKKILEAYGIELLEYLPNYSFLAYVVNPPDVDLKTLNIRAIIPYKKEFKFSKLVSKMTPPDWAIPSSGKVKLMIEPHLNVEKSVFQEKLRFNEIIITYNDPSNSYYFIESDQRNINNLAGIDIIKFIDYVPSPPEKEDDPARSLHRGNMLDSDHPMGRKYDGTGISISIADDGRIGPHIDFTGRVTQFVNFDNGTHGDMTSGIAIGAGNLNPAYRGAAPGASLYYYNIGGYPHIAIAVTNLNNRDVVITSTSFSISVTVDHTVFSVGPYSLYSLHDGKKS